MDRVFERFYRVDKSHSKEIGGTGLGLSIVKHGAAFHNAKVSLESTEGQGTVIRLVFPTKLLTSSSLKIFPRKGKGPRYRGSFPFVCPPHGASRFSSFP